MLFNSWLRGLRLLPERNAANSGGRQKLNKRRGSCQLDVEILEGRWLPSAYVVTDLGTLGGRTSQAIGISPSGLIVGDAENAAHETHAFLYQAGVMTDLGTLGGTGSVAYAVNDAGQVAGYSQTANGDTHAFLYSGGIMTDLGTFGGPTSYAFGINKFGQVTGVADFPGNTGTVHAFLYSPGGSLQDLGTLGSNYSEGRAVNDLGQVAGNSGTGHGSTPAFLYSGGVMSNLGTLPGGTYCQVHNMNNLGQVVGTSNTPTADQRAFLYSPGIGMQDLGTLGGVNSQASGINDLGQVVGVSNLPGDTLAHAFLDQSGVMTDLNSLIPAGFGWDLSEAFGINNAGAIVGDGIGPNNVNYAHAFLLTPVPTVTLTAANATYTGAPYDTANLTTMILPASASGSLSYVFYADAGGQNTIADPTNAGAYYVQAVFTSSDLSNFTNATSSIVPFNITAKSLSVDATTQGTLNIAKAGTISFALQITDGLVASNNDVATLFNGATFTITVSGTSYSLTSTATVAADGTINVSMQMSQGLQNALLAALSQGNTVDFNLSALSNDGNYSLAADAISRLISEGKLKFAVV
jgi:probable HAF family extracellular repeat protein